jgi:hypothetical protein
MSRWVLILGTALLAAAGCGPMGVETTYGRSRGASVNGTGALVEMFRAEGHEVRVTSRLNEALAEWADTVVRFAPYPGRPDRAEAAWYEEWLADDPGRRLIYVPRDFNAESEYWGQVLAQLPKDADPALRLRIERRKDSTANWADELPHPSKEPAPVEPWFDVAPAPGAPINCKRLEGPWAVGVDPKDAALTRHQWLRAGEADDILLTGDREPLAIALSGPADSDEPQVLVVANGSFLLNEPLVHRARRPLAGRVVRWAGASPRRVAFVESRSPAGGSRSRPPSLFAILWVEPFGWIAAHLGAFGLLASLAAAARLGRPRPEPPAGADRPVAHAEALGDLLARTRDLQAARALLDAYRRWRHPTSAPPSHRRTGMTR